MDKGKIMSARKDVTVAGVDTDKKPIIVVRKVWKEERRYNPVSDTVLIHIATKS